jgi:type I restriction enzyme S subunit
VTKNQNFCEISELVQKIVGGGTPERNNSDYWNGGIPWATVKDFKDGKHNLALTEEEISLTGLKYSAANLIPPLVPIICTRMAVGRVAVANFIVAINQDLKAIYPNEKVDSEYLVWLIESIRSELEALSTGSTVKGIRLAELLSLKVFCPNKQEQTQIATILSTIDRAIEQTEALIAKQQRIKTGLMQDLLTKGIDENGNIRSEETHEFKDSPLGRIPVEWEVKKIEQKLERIIDYRGQTPKKVTEGIPLLTAKNVRDGFIEKEPQEFIADSAYNSWMSRGIPEVGDVLFTTEAPMGNVASIPNYRIALAQRLLTLCPKINELSQDFLFWILHWKRSKERIELLTSGSTVVGIKQSVFRKVIFAFPSYNEQERIYAVLNSHDEINKNEKHKLKKLQRLKTGLMQDLLTGKVRVTELIKERETDNL